MNVRLTWMDEVESWDTRVDVEAPATRARLKVVGSVLKLWSINSDIEKKDLDRVPDWAARVLKLEGEVPWDLPGYLQAAHEQLGLLRLDVDGETIWQAPADGGVDTTIDGLGGGAW